MTESTFREGIGLLSTYFQAPEPEKVKQFWIMFKSVPDESFKECIRKLVETFTPTNTCPFPVPAQFYSAMPDRDFSGVIERVKVACARTGQYQNMNFDDPALHYVINAYGGWPVVCCWTDHDWQINTKHFEVAYKVAVENRRIGPERLIGRIDQENAKKGISGPMDDKKIEDRSKPATNEDYRQLVSDVMRKLNHNA